MSSTGKTIPLRRQEVAARPAIPLIALGLSLSIFVAVSFLLYPVIDWARPEMIGAGAVWAFLSGWYVALAFGSLYNYFAARALSPGQEHLKA